VLYRELNRDLREARQGDDPKALLALVPAFQARSAVRGALDEHRMLSTLGGEISRLEQLPAKQLPADARAPLAAARKAFDELVAMTAGAAGQAPSTKSEGVLAGKYRDVLRALDQAVLQLDQASPLTDKTLGERVRHRNDYWQNQWYTRTPPQKGEPMGAWIKAAAKRFLDDNDLSVTLVGQENVPKDRPVIYAASHRSGAIDRFVMGAALPFDDDKMMYQVREGSPLDVQAQKTYGPDNPWIVTGAKTPATEAGGASSSSLQRTIDKATQGFAAGAKTLITYPEGTGTLTGEARYPAMGTVLMAAATGAAIVPVVSHDSFDVRPFEGGEVSVRAMPPIDVGALRKALGPDVGEQQVLQLAHALLEFDLGSTYRSQA
jgi:1-acyl-sn-glycerol-3-phosphate acyltransferase